MLPFFMVSLKMMVQTFLQIRMFHGIERSPGQKFKKHKQVQTQETNKRSCLDKTKAGLPQCARPYLKIKTDIKACQHDGADQDQDNFVPAQAIRHHDDKRYAPVHNEFQVEKGLPITLQTWHIILCSLGNVCIP